VADRGPGDDQRQPVALAVDGAFWIPLFNQGEVVQVEPLV